MTLCDIMKSNELPVLRFRSNKCQVLQHYTEAGSHESTPIYVWNEVMPETMHIGDDTLVFTLVDENLIKIVQRTLSGYEPYSKELHQGECVNFYGNEENSDHDGMTREVQQVWIEISWTFVK